MDDIRYDAFVSYASQNREWVIEHLVQPLKRCRAADGRKARIFYDRDSMRVAAVWSEYLDRELQASAEFVAVGSKDYFESPACKTELECARRLGMSRGKNMIHPLLLDTKELNSTWLWLSGIQHLSIGVSDWFERLCDALGLMLPKEALTLRFATPLPSKHVENNTLPMVRVEVVDDDGRHSADVMVHLSALGAELQGDTSMASGNGVAEFSDLSVSGQGRVRLLAAAKGCVSIETDPFEIVQPITPPPLQGVSLQTDGQPIFFRGGSALAVCADDRVMLRGYDGSPIGGDHLLYAPIRDVVRDEEMIAISDWSGCVRVLDAAGNDWFWDLSLSHDVRLLEKSSAPTSERLAVPGGLAMSAGIAYVGLWKGLVYRLKPGISAAEPLFFHDGGVQCMAVADGHFILVDLAGRMVVLRGGERIDERQLEEPIVHHVKTVNQSVIFLGATRLLKYDLRSRHMLSEPLPPLKEVRGVAGDVATPVVCDVEGRGVRFSAPGLTFACRFRVPNGATPTSADDAGDWAVFRQTDGAHVMIYKNKVVYTHAGAMAVSPDGLHFAIRVDDSLRLLDRTAMKSLCAGHANG